MNETAFADRLVELINSASNDDDYMLLHTARSFSEDMLITSVAQHTATVGAWIEIQTGRGEVFYVDVKHVNTGIPA